MRSNTSINASPGGIIPTVAANAEEMKAINEAYRLIVIVGVWKVHAVIVSARKSVAPSHPVHRYVWIQELAFWSMVCVGGYGIYLLMSAI